MLRFSVECQLRTCKRTRSPGQNNCAHPPFVVAIQIQCVKYAASDINIDVSIYVLAYFLCTSTLYVPSTAPQGAQSARETLPFVALLETTLMATFIGKCGRAGHVQSVQA
jgi:hypothetical protein